MARPGQPELGVATPDYCPSGLTRLNRLVWKHGDSVYTTAERYHATHRLAKIKARNFHTTRSDLHFLRGQHEVLLLLHVLVHGLLHLLSQNSTHVYDSLSQ